REAVVEGAGGGVRPRFWEDESGQQVTLSGGLRELRSAFETKDIVVLSTRKDEQSCASTLAQAGIALAPLRKADPGIVEIPYTTIHAFKGLEAQAVVVTDVTSLDDEQRALLYVAMSRARIRLILLMKESCRAAYKKLLIRNLDLQTGSKG